MGFDCILVDKHLYSFTFNDSEWLKCISHLKSATYFTTKPATLKEWRFHQKIQFFSSSLH